MDALALVKVLVSPYEDPSEWDISRDELGEGRRSQCHVKTIRGQPMPIRE